LRNSSEILQKVRKIAIVRTDRLGDMVLTLPMCNALKELYPEACISLVARSYARDLLLNCTAIDEVLFIDDYSGGIKDIFRQNSFDAVFFPRPRFNECLAAFMKRIPLRIGTAYRWYSLLFNHKVHDHRKNANFHEAEYNTRLVESASGMKCETKLVKPYVDFEIRKNIIDKLKSSGIVENEPFIIVHPGSGGSAYDWKADNFGILAKKIYEELHYKIVITGSEAEKDSCTAVKKICPGAVDLCGQTGLREMISLISLSKLFISNSTGPLHIAAALDIPVIGLYPNTPHLSSKRWGPYSAKGLTVSPTDGDDMNLISINRVYYCVVQQLNRI